MYFYSNRPGVIDIMVKNMPKHRQNWASASSATTGFSGVNHAGGQVVISGVTSPVGKGACTFTVGDGEFIRIKNIGQQVYKMTAGLGYTNGQQSCARITQGGNVFGPTSGYYNPSYTSADACPGGWTDMTNVNTPQAYQYPTFQAGGWLLASGTAAGHVQAVTNPSDYWPYVGNWRIKSNADGTSSGFRNGAPYEYTDTTTTVGWAAWNYWGWGCGTGETYYLAITIRYCVPVWSNSFLFG
jgi:hypothetical protein